MFKFTSYITVLYSIITVGQYSTPTIVVLLLQYLALSETCSRSAIDGVESSTFEITKLSKSGVSGHSTTSSLF